MGGLAHYLESGGIATTQISLVRLHTEITRPPRALWVSFELGRPFGPPNDADFQREVVLSALELLEAPSGPLIVDYPIDAPPSQGEVEGWACPISFETSPDETQSDHLLLSAEVSHLQPWFERSREARQRTTFGSSNLSLEQIVDLLAHSNADGMPDNPQPERPVADVIRDAAEDLKAFYFEAAAAQPGEASAAQMRSWFWNETYAAKLIRRLSETMSRSSDESMAFTGQALMVPRAEK